MRLRQCPQRSRAALIAVLGVAAVAACQAQPAEEGASPVSLPLTHAEPVLMRGGSPLRFARGTRAASRRHDDAIGLRARGFIGDTSAGPFTTIDAPRAGLFTVVFGIENDGRAVGGYVDQDGRLHGFLRTPDMFQQINVPGARATLAARINARGQIVGGYSRERLIPALELTHGFLLEDGRFTSIDVPGAARTQAFSINGVGQIAGEYVDGEGATHGFLMHGDELTTIDAPGATATFAYDIDDAGRVLGFSFDGAAFHGFLRDEQGRFTAIDMPGAEQRGTVTLGFNNLGQIVGFALVLVGDQLTSASFVLENGRFTTIEVPDAQVSTIAFDVSDQGQFVGSYDLAGHGFLREARSEFMVIDPPDGAVNEVLGLNNRDQIVGRYIDLDGRARAFLKDKRGFSPIDAPDATATSAFQINDRGQIVGNYSTTSNNTGYPTRGFVLEANGQFTLIDVPDAQHTSPVSINNLGQVVGECQDAAGAFHGFLRDENGAFTTIDAPDAPGGTALTAINERGQLAGGFVDAGGGVHAFVLQRGVFTPIEVPGAVGTQPFAINNDGDIVGVSFDGVRFRGFLLKDGRYTRITPPGAFLPWLIGSAATDIDEQGRIVGASL
jgi:uncharacterized membrane protein